MALPNYYKITPCCPELGAEGLFNIPGPLLISGVYGYNGNTIPFPVNGIFFNEDSCYTISYEGVGDYDDAPISSTFSSNGEAGCDYPKCEDCLVPCYTLYNCDGEWINTTVDLSAAVGGGPIQIYNTITLDPIPGTWYVFLNTGKCTSPNNDIAISHLPATPCVCRCFTIITTTDEYIKGGYIDCDGTLQKVIPMNTSFCSLVVPFIESATGEYDLVEGDPCVDNECPIKCFELTECTTGEIITSQSQSLFQYLGLDTALELVGHPGCWQVTSDAAADCTCPVDLTVTIVHKDCPTCIGIIAYKLTNCENILDIKYTYDDLSEYLIDGIGLTLLTDCGCYKLEQIDFQPTSTSPIVIISSFNGCPECLRPYYRLTACNEEVPDVYTFTDLSDYVGRVINIKGCDTCWEVFNTNTPINPGIVTVTDSFELCEDCTPPLPCLCNRITNYSTSTKEYEYIDCNDDTVLLTLAAGESSGKICLKRWVIDYPDTDNLEVFEECSQITNLCYQYTITVPGQSLGILYYKNCKGVVNFQNISLTKFPTVIIICGIDGQTSSDIYLNDLIPVPFEKNTVCNIPIFVCPETRPQRKIKPGYSVPTCDIDKWEKITCRASEILYKEVMRLRYGMSNCCPEDDEKWLIKKELIDLAALVDPDYICSPVQSCGCAPSSCGCGCSSPLKTCSSQ